MARCGALGLGRFRFGRRGLVCSVEVRSVEVWSGKVRQAWRGEARSGLVWRGLVW